LLRDRVTAVRTDLLELAVMLERADDPDPARVAALHDLLANGCDSPLYNPEVHVSELRATLYYVRSGLDTKADGDVQGASQPTGGAHPRDKGASWYELHRSPANRR
jgi:hypothetical protein